MLILRAPRCAAILSLFLLLGAAQFSLAQEAPVTANADWSPVVETFDGVPMALSPPGCFIMGQADGAPNEQPMHEICFSAAFWIDLNEVSHDQFAQFGAVAGRPAAFDAIGGDLPRERVTWFEARDLCSLRGARLPSEAEWEYAARGPDGLIYPWGDTFETTLAVTVLDPVGHPDAGGGRAAGASWVGALDMAGNVWEWTNSLFLPYPFTPDDGREEAGRADMPRVIRGGAWSYSAELSRAAARGFRPPTTETTDIGFRCARDA